jgi:hypothetical protein
LEIDYLDLYLMATDGREQIQIFNYFDSCCFWGDGAYTYADFVSKRAEALGGRFSVLVDHYSRHNISPGARRLLMSVP